MGHNPYGDSCGSSTVVPPRQVRINTGKLGTPNARLSDTASGKSPKRPKTREEVENASAKREEHITVMRTPQPVCTCKECKQDDKMFEEMEQDIIDLASLLTARIERNKTEEERTREAGRESRARLLADRGDSDS